MERLEFGYTDQPHISAIDQLNETTPSCPVTHVELHNGMIISISNDVLVVFKNKEQERRCNEGNMDWQEQHELPNINLAEI